MKSDTTLRASQISARCALAAIIASGLAAGAHADKDDPLAFFKKGSFAGEENPRYVPPVTNPLFNETPFITTEIRPIYIFNAIPEDFVTDGGEIHVIAAELRLALTDRLGFFASKDGFVDANFDSVLPDENGFANISAGLKYALYHDKATQSILTVGFEYEVPLGDIETGGIELQGAGDGFVDVFVAGATTIGKFGLESNAGFNIAIDGGTDTSIFHFAAHVDYELTPKFYPLVELNVFTPFNDGNRITGPLAGLDGVDLVNFGSSSRDTTVTGAAGFRYRFSKNIIVGFGAETAFTNDSSSILDWRLTSDITLHF